MDRDGRNQLEHQPGRGDSDRHGRGSKPECHNDLYAYGQKQRRFGYSRDYNHCDLCFCRAKGQEFPCEAGINGCTSGQHTLIERSPKTLGRYRISVRYNRRIESLGVNGFGSSLVRRALLEREAPAVLARFDTEGGVNIWNRNKLWYRSTRGLASGNYSDVVDSCRSSLGSPRSIQVHLAIKAP